MHTALDAREQSEEIVALRLVSIGLYVGTTDTRHTKMDHDRIIYMSSKLNIQHPIRSKFSPSKIRSIRKRLGLTQAEAGEVLEGGPSGFAKYERGDVSPSGALNGLLRLVEADPNLIEVLRDGSPQPMVRRRGFAPFEVTGEHVTAMEAPAFAYLLQRLLAAESTANALPKKRRIHVPSNLNAPDGGEDGRIEWAGGPGETPFLPCRRIVFQLKSGKISVSKAAEEVMRGSRNDASRRPKEQVGSVLRAGGCYVVLCSQRYVHKEIQRREQGILKALRKSGLSVRDSQVEFRDADGIATWVNEYPAVAAWVLAQTQPGTVECFRSWDHWKSRSEHNRTPWIEDKRLPPLRRRLMQEAVEPRGVLHLAGLSGVGKSRLLLEAFGSGELAAAFLDLVMHADESEHDPAAIKGAVRTLAEMGRRAIVVVDQCTASTRQSLVNMVRGDSSRLSLVTVEDATPSDTRGPHQMLIEQAPENVVEGIVGSLASGLPSQDMGRLVRFSKGYPEFAISVVSAWNASKPLGRLPEHTYVKTFLQAEVHENPQLIVRSAQLLAVFGLIGIDEDSDERLGAVARVGGLNAQELNQGIQHLADIGAARRRGTLYALEPRPVSLYLAERQWKAWTPTRWDEVLAGDLSPEYKVSAARQLRSLNTTEVSRSVIKRVCRLGGPLDNPEQISDSAYAEMLAALVEVDARCVVDLLGRTLSGIDDLKEIRGEARRNLVWTLRKAAFPRDTFDSAACLLLGLAVAENEPYANNATGVLAELFPLILGSTAADSGRRLKFLQDAADSTDPKQRIVVVEALTKGVKTEHFERMAGPETHGLRPSLDSWQPTTHAEATDYLLQCARLLAEFATVDDKAGASARYELAEGLRSFISSDLIGIDDIESIALRVRGARGRWPEAIRALESYLEFDDCAAAQSERVKDLIDRLQPQDLALRTLDLVSQYPGKYLRDAGLDDDAREDLLREDIRRLADVLLDQPEVLRSVLPALCSRLRSQAWWLGECIARQADAALDLLEMVKDGYVRASKGDRNDDLLTGFLYGLWERGPEAVDRFKREAAESTQFARTLPHVCRSLGVTADDIRLVLQALEARLLPPDQLQLWLIQGCFKRVPASDVETLFDKLLEHSAKGFFTAIGLLDTHCMGSRDTLDQFLPQVRKAAEKVTEWKRPEFSEIAGWHFETLMGRVLKRGSDDPDAQAVAASLASGFVQSLGSRTARMLERLLPTLLADFAGVTLPFIGAAILSANSKVWLLEFAMRGRVGPALERTPVMAKVPEETLIAWCKDHPDSAPAFAAATLPVLATAEDGPARPVLHPTMARVIDEFGGCEGVLESVGRNMTTFTWVGSPSSRLKLYRAPLESLRNHEKAVVGRWAEAQLRYIDESSEQWRSWVEEQEARMDG